MFLQQTNGSFVKIESIKKKFYNISETICTVTRREYIENRFGELSEHGYIRIDGCPCHVLHVEPTDSELIFYTDDGRNYPFGEFEIYETSDGGLIGLRSTEEKIKYRFTWNAAKELSDHLTEEEETTYLEWNGVKMEIPKYLGEIPVPLPNDYS